MIEGMNALGGTSFRERIERALADPAPEAPHAAVRSAAIALILHEHGGSLELLLIERAKRDGDPWSGHMALPGGHWEPSDSDLAATAERETLEEVGLDLRAHGERLGRLSDCLPSRGVPIAVRPFVYWLPTRPPLLLSAEVRRALWVPAAPLLEGAQRATHTLSQGDESLQFPAWDIDGHLVWGLTYRVLEEFFSRFSRLLAHQ
jgi:8-oxo-dGTP pyrophosphatase MutT (NUDIX family)